MNRQFKFRVWSIENKTFLQNNDPVQAITSNGKLIISDSDWYEGLTNVNMRDYIIQQFTGLKDINNKEIYEGDILKWPKGWMYPEMNGEIKWIINGYFFSNKSVEWRLPENTEAEIIGNIFENTELLKNNEKF